jgi:serine/threonine protein phosphatase 1
MPPRTIAIGDIHGCAAALDALLTAIQPGDDDTLVTLGDCVDRGPDSKMVLDRLIELTQSTRLVPLLGNHEVMMLDAVSGREVDFWLSCGGFDTLASYGGKLAAIPAAHVDFLRQCPLHHEKESHFFLHANYLPELPLDEQPEDVRLWEHLTFRVPGPHVSGKTAVVGHTPQRNGEILDRGHVICVDTYCVGGGWLTALDTASGRVWQANADGELRDGQNSRSFPI